MSNEKLTKTMEDGVYVLRGVDSTEQVRAFYKEVVEKNIEKYVAISVQNIKFKFEPATDSAVLLQKDGYAVNPLYRKIEVKPVEEIVEDIKTAEETDSTDEVSRDVDSVEDKKPEDAEIDTASEIADDEDITDEPMQDIDYEIEYELLKDENESLKAELVVLKDDIKFEKERADTAEKDVDFIRAKKNELDKIILEKDKEIEELKVKIDEGVIATIAPVAFTLEDLFNKAHELGYEITAKKIF